MGRISAQSAPLHDTGILDAAGVVSWPHTHRIAREWREGISRGMETSAGPVTLPGPVVQNRLAAFKAFSTGTESEDDESDLHRRRLQTGDMVEDATSSLGRECESGCGGDVYIGMNSSNIAMFNLSISDSHSFNDGGSIFIGGSNSFISMEGISCTKTHAGGNGGCIRVYKGNSDVTILASNFSGCDAGNSGGGVSLGILNARLSIHESTFESCTAANSGGAVTIFQSNMNATLTGSTMRDCAVNAGTGLGGGLAIFYQNHYMTLSTLTFTMCLASRGGAFYTDTANLHLSVINSVFEGNMAHLSTTLATGLGGGVFFGAMNDYATFDGCDFVGNSASFAGGAIHLLGFGGAANFTTIDDVLNEPSMLLQRELPSIMSVIELDLKIAMALLNRQAIAAAANVLSELVGFENGNDFDRLQAGGLVGNYYFTMLRCNLTRNSAAIAGGGIVLYNANRFAQFIEVNLNENFAGFGGGCIYLQAQNDFVLMYKTQFMSCTLSGNPEEAETVGGGVAAALSNIGLVVGYSTFSRCSAGQGAAIYLSTGNIHAAVFKSRIVDNLGFFQAVMSFGFDNSGAQIFNVTFARNIVNYPGNVVRLETTGSSIGLQAEFKGAAFAMSADNYNLTITSCVFDSNSVFDGSGSAIFIGGSGETYSTQTLKNAIKSSDALESSFLVEGSFFVNNTCIIEATTIRPSVVSLHSVNNFLMRDSRFENNPSTSCLDIGGSSAIVTFQRVLWIDNFANGFSPVADLGGQGATTVRNLTFVDCDFVGNRNVQTGIRTVAGTAGGALYIAKSLGGLTFKRCNFERNAAAVGGAIYLMATKFVTFEMCNFKENTAQKYGGAIVLASQATATTFAGCNFMSNSANDGTGGAVYIVDRGDGLQITDFASYNATEAKSILQSPHPFLSRQPTPSKGGSGLVAQTIWSEEIYNPQVRLWVLNFLEGSSITIYDTIYIYDAAGNSYPLGTHPGASNNEAEGGGYKEGEPWPGKGGVALEVPGPLLRVVLKGPDKFVFSGDKFSYGVGVTIFVSAILHDDVIQSLPRSLTTTNFTANHVGISSTYSLLNDLGGTGPNGGAISFNQIFENAVITNAQFIGNSASASGGAIHYQSTVKNVRMINLMFQDNTAGLNGGAINFFATNYGHFIEESTFMDNVASGAGGAISLSTGNGLGDYEIIDDNIMHFFGCTFVRNVATQGAVLISLVSNAIALSNCVIERNGALEALKSRGVGVGLPLVTTQGGALYLPLNSYMMINNSIFDSNKASVQGGAIYMGTSVVLTLVNSSFSRNTAGTAGSLGSGGAIFAYQTKQMNWAGFINFTDNSADAGGAINMYTQSVILPNDPLSPSPVADNLQVLFRQNKAQLGSAWFIREHRGLPENLITMAELLFSRNPPSIEFLENSASIGTIFWLAQSAAATQPILISNATENFHDNEAITGEEYATQCFRISAVSMLSVPAHNSAISPPLLIHAYDYYGNPSNSSGLDSSIAKITVNTTIVSSDCQSQTAFTRGTTMLDIARDADVHFENLVLSCVPNGRVTLEFSAPLFPQTLTSYVPTTTVQVNFQDCRPGQTYVSGNAYCETCRNGTYSLSYSPGAICAPCPEGVIACWGNTLVLDEKNWRANVMSANIYECADEMSCPGGQATGDESCGDGYEGVICSLCSEGYYNSNFGCELCTGGGIFGRTTFIVFATLVVVILAFIIRVALLARKHEVELSDAIKKFEDNAKRESRRLKEVGNLSSEESSDESDSDKSSVGSSEGPRMPPGERNDMRAAKRKSTKKSAVIKPLELEMGVLNSSKDASGRIFKAGADSDDESDDEPTRNGNGQSLPWVSSFFTSKKSKKQGGGEKKETCTVENPLHTEGSAQGPAGKADGPTGGGTKLSRWTKMYAWIKLRYGQLVVRGKIIFATVQILSTIPSTTEVEYPPSFQRFLRFFSFLDVGSFSGSVECALDYDYVDFLAFEIFAPPVLIVLGGLTFVTHYYVLYKQRAIKILKKAGGEAKGKAHLDSLINLESAGIWQSLRFRYTQVLLFFTYFILPGITVSIFRMFVYENVEGASYLVADTTIQIPSTRASEGIIIAIVGLFLYPIGVPVYYFWRLSHSIDEIRSRASKSDETTDKDGLSATKNSLLFQLQRRAQHRKKDESESLDAFYKSVGPAASGLLRRMSAQAERERTDNQDDLSAGAQDGLNLNATTRAAMSAARDDNSDASDEEDREEEFSHRAQLLTFLFESYKPAYWYWEIIETYRRLILTAVLSVLSAGSSEQIVAAMLLALAFIGLYGSYQPYDDAQDGELAHIGQYQIYFTFFAALIVQNDLLDPEYTSLFTVLLIFLNLAVAVYAVFVQFWQSSEDFEEQDKLKLVLGETTQEEIDADASSSLTVHLPLDSTEYGKRTSGRTDSVSVIRNPMLLQKKVKKKVNATGRPDEALLDTHDSDAESSSDSGGEGNQCKVPAGGNNGSKAKPKTVKQQKLAEKRENNLTAAVVTKPQVAALRDVNRQFDSDDEFSDDD
jgi:predicted outer membrane repeat protein